MRIRRKNFKLINGGIFMKYPKLLVTLPFLFSMVGCGGRGSYIGTYSFQLGSNEGTHTAIHLELTNDPFTTDNPELAKFNPKRFKLDFDINGFSSKEVRNNSSSSEPSSSESVSSENVSSEEEPSEPTIDPFADFDAFQGYYYTNGEMEKTGELLHLGIDLLDIFEISPEVTELILYATVTPTEINVVIPVSLNDLYYQLYWYGYRVGSLFEAIEPVNLYEEDKSFFELALAGNKPGTHPTKDVITAIQDYQKKREEDKPAGYQTTEKLFSNYRDFHTLNMGLKKNG